VGRIGLAEAKSSPGLGSLGVDSQGIRQGSRAFFESRLLQGERFDLLRELQSGNADLFAGFAKSDRLIQFDPANFVTNESLRRGSRAYTIIPK
jgi:hypothetical protein